MAPKYKKSKLKAALSKLQDTHQKRQRATEIRDMKEAALAAGPKKTAQVGGANGNTSSATLKAQRKAMSKLPPPPYYDYDTILLVGEANFSFAKSLALEILNRGDTITATTLDTFTTMTEKYIDAQENVKELEDAGATVLFEVDATKLSKIKSFKGKRFSKIVFNFPHAGTILFLRFRLIQRTVIALRPMPLRQSRTNHETWFSIVGAGIKDQDRNVVSNQKLLRSFFESATPYLADTDLGDKKAGEIHVTMKTGLPYDLWNIKRLAAGTGLLGNKTSFPFKPEQYPGYEHRRTIGFKEGVSQGENVEILNKSPKTFVFVKRTAKEADMAKESETASIRKRKRAGEDVSDDEE
ncbi:hypothetical protein BGX33_006249 [Mortierella sp. NVP41]|nr:hypothetical protein BGX33_006249 [Mortierella sp. NVP41]